MEYSKSDCINDIRRAWLCAEVTIPGDRWRVILSHLREHFGIVQCPKCDEFIEEPERDGDGCEDPFCGARDAT